MIYARDKGRLCNNILQYGHVYALGRENGRRTLSMRFAYKYPFFRISTMPGHNFFRYALAKYAAKLGLITVVSFDTPGEDCEARKMEILGRRSVIVEGWEVRFYELFLKYLDEIRSLFDFTTAIKNRVGRVMEGSEGKLKIGLHVRRGDYATWNSGRYYFYDHQYVAVARKIMDLYSGRDIVFFVCGNDPSMSRAEFEEGLRGADVVFPAGNPGEDLCLLSRCDMIAGPPSTFSLVAAMYRDLPLYWIENPAAPVAEESFGRFDSLFRQIK